MHIWGLLERTGKPDTRLADCLAGQSAEPVHPLSRYIRRKPCPGYSRKLLLSLDARPQGEGGQMGGTLPRKTKQIRSHASKRDSEGT